MDSGGSLADRLFDIPEGPRSALAVVLWWEKRRPAYNLVLALAGVPSLLLFYLFVELSGAVPAGEDAVEPLVLFVAPLLANVLYTAGWLVEVPVRVLLPGESRRLGPRLLKLGIGFSLVVIALPPVLWAVVCLVRLFSSLG